MREFDVQSYGAAESCADAIKNIGDRIMDVFNSVDKTMNDLYGENWASSGANNAHERYMEIRKNYEVFYQDILNMNTHVHNTVENYKTADAQADTTISAI